VADTLPNIPLPAGGQWVDLYAATSIPVGTALEIRSINSVGVNLVISATKPDDDSGYETIKTETANYVESGASGAWARSVGGTSVNVKVREISQEPPKPETSSSKTYNTDAWFRNKAVFDRSLLHGMFTFNVPADKWYEMIDDVEQTAFVSATSVDGALRMASGALDEKRQLRTFRHPRYQPNRGHLYSDAGWFPDPNAAGERTWGVFTKEAGVGFRLRSGVLYAVRRTTIGGVTSDIETVITLPVGVDLSKNNVFDIQFQWRGAGDYFFYINLQKVASLDLLGTLSGLSIFNPALPIAFECINQGDAVEMYVGCVDVSSEGGDDNGKSYGSITTETESASVAISGFNVPIIAVRNKSLFGSLLNTRDVLSLLATAYGDQRCVFRVWATRDDTAITLNDQSLKDFRDGHMDYVVYDTPNVATPMTFDTSKAALVFGARVDQDQSYSTSAIFEGRTDIYQTPGDTFIFTMHRETGQACNVGVTYEFAEAI
jgi:hypothetical protein